MTDVPAGHYTVMGDFSTSGPDGRTIAEHGYNGIGSHGPITSVTVEVRFGSIPRTVDDPYVVG